MNREEAINKIREWSFLNEEELEAIKTLVPELRESEDERIRKWLIEMVEELRKANPTNAEHNGNCSEAIAYLEKQKEQNHVERNEEDERIRQALIRFFKNTHDWVNLKYDGDEIVAYLEKQKALSELGKYIATERAKPGFMFAGNDSVSWEELPLGVRKHDYPYYFIGDLDCYPFDVEKKKEQKPAECVSDSRKFDEGFKTGREVGFREGVESVKPEQKWDEEDEEMLEDIISNFAFNKGDMTDALIAQYNRFFDKIMSLKPQSQQEWSEEERKHLYNAIEAVKYVYDVSEGTGGFKCVEFLKSLRPQPHWKPSDEQMEYLGKAIITLGNEGDCKTANMLMELRNDLKKL